VSTKILGAVVATALGFAGGVVFDLLGVPLSWMLGAMCFVAIAAMFNLPLYLPANVSMVTKAVIGVMLGATITPALLQQVIQWPLVWLVMLATSAAGSGLAYLVLRKCFAFDAPTALHSAMPGGLVEMVVLGDERGGDPQSIALVHTIRVSLTIVIVTGILTLALGVHDLGQGSVVAVNWLRGIDMLSFAWLAGCAVAGLFVARFLGLPAGALLGPLIVSGVAHLTGVTEFKVGPLLVASAQVGLGIFVGLRFRGVGFVQVKATLRAALSALLVHIGLAVVAAMALTQITSFDFASLLIAFSPGGLNEMSLIAIALGTDVAFVVGTHLLRVLLVLSFAPILFRWIKRLPQRKRSR